MAFFFFSEEKGERRSTFTVTARTSLVQKLVAKVTGKSLSDTARLYNYGCWCGQRGHGKYVDNFD